MNAPVGFHERHAGLFEPSHLASKRAFWAGLGSVGSTSCAMLVRAGVEQVIARDLDSVSATNLCRTIYNEADVGSTKADALTRHLLAIRSGLTVDARQEDLFLQDDEELIALIESSDLVFLSTDHPPTQARIAALAYPRKPTVICGVFARGTGGEVIFTLPDETSCYACVLGEMRGANAPNRGQTNYGIASGQLVGEPALGIDILHVTTCAAKIALALLLRGTDAAPAAIIDPEKNVLFVGNAVDWIFDAPFQTVWGRAERRAQCLCRLAPGASTASLIDLDATEDGEASL